MPEQWNAANSLESRMNRVREKVWSFFSSMSEEFSGEDEVMAEPLPNVIATFDDAVIVQDYENENLYEIDYSDLSGEITLGQPREVESLYVQKKILASNPDLSLKDVEGIISDWDSWAGDFNGCIASLESRPGISDPYALCAWLHYQAEGKWPAEKARKPELTGPIVMKNAAKRIAYAAVLVPGETDVLGEPALTEERVEKAAHEWMESYRNVDLQHSLNNVGVPVESYLLPQEMTVKNVYDGEEMLLPKGSWILGSKTDETTWEAVEKGDLTGYSIMGIRRSALKSDSAKKSDEALKRTLLSDLGDDWVAAYVSFVDSPAVPKAKFFALKSNKKIVEDVVVKENKSFFERVMDTLSGGNTVEKEGRTYSQSVLNKLREAKNVIDELVRDAENERSQKGGEEDMKEEEVRAIVQEAVKEAKDELTLIVKDALKAAPESENEVENKDESGEQEESTESVNTTTTEAEAEDKKDKNTTGTETGNTESKSSEESSDEDECSSEDENEFESFKSEIIKRLDKVEAKKGIRSESKAIKGQDGQEDPKDRADKLGRDLHGRRRKEK